MGTTQPIRQKESLKKFVEYYQTAHPVPRNYALIVLGLYTALRISDILNLRWTDVYDFVRYRAEGALVHAGAALDAFLKTRPDVTACDYIFTRNTDYRTPLCRSSAFRIVKRAAEDALHEEHISCHSLRKTFGYQAWKQGTPPALLMDIYNHSSYTVTKRYLGIEQDERDSLFMQMNFSK